VTVSIAEAAASGDHRAALTAMRDKLAADMDAAPPAVVAQVAARLQSVLAELNGLPVPAEESFLDELERRRAERLSTSKPADAPKRAKG